MVGAITAKDSHSIDKKRAGPWPNPFLNGYLKSAATGIDTAAARVHVMAPAGIHVITATAGAG